MSLSGWCLKRIKEHDKVDEVEIIDENLLKVKVKHGTEDGFLVFTKSEEYSTINSVAGIDPNSLDFFLNIKKDAHLDGKLLKLASVSKFATGDLGDLFRALNDENISNYINPNIKYIMRGFKQHHRVKDFERLDNCRFRIERKGLNDVIVIALHKYDLTAELVRSAIEKYGKFDAILTSDPNCRRTEGCDVVADNAGLKILNFRELHSDLNKPW